MFVSELYKIMVNKVAFVGFRGTRSPQSPPAGSAPDWVHAIWTWYHFTLRFWTNGLNTCKLLLFRLRYYFGIYRTAWNDGVKYQQKSVDSAKSLMIDQWYFDTNLLLWRWVFWRETIRARLKSVSTSAMSVSTTAIILVKLAPFSIFINCSRCVPNAYPQKATCKLCKVWIK